MAPHTSTEITKEMEHLHLQQASGVVRRVPRRKISSRPQRWVYASKCSKYLTCQGCVEMTMFVLTSALVCWSYVRFNCASTTQTDMGRCCLGLKKESDLVKTQQCSIHRLDTARCVVFTFTVSYVHTIISTSEKWPLLLRGGSTPAI